MKLACFIRRGQAASESAWRRSESRIGRESITKAREHHGDDVDRQVVDQSDSEHHHSVKLLNCRYDTPPDSGNAGGWKAHTKLEESP